MDENAPGPASRQPGPSESVIARVIADALDPLIQDAEAAGLGMLAYLLGVARIEAEDIAEKPAG